MATDRLDDLEGKREDFLGKIECDLHMEEEEEEHEVKGDDTQNGNDNDSTGRVSYAEKLELVRTKERQLVLAGRAVNVDSLTSTNGC